MTGAPRLRQLSQVGQLADGLTSDALTTDSTSRQSGWYRKHNVLFAVKTDYHKLLDVARETYKENCEDIAACE